MWFVMIPFIYVFVTFVRSKLGGRTLPDGWNDGMLWDTRLGDEDDNITVEVNNVLVQRKIHNVFGVIKGYMDAGTVYCYTGL